MRRQGEYAPPQNPASSASSAPPRSDGATLARLLPYLWTYKWRVVAAIAFMLGAKLANVSVPLLLKQLVDTMDVPPGGTTALLVVPVGLLLAYGLLRLSTSLFTELRELVFAKATHGAARSIALQTFEHLHSLSLRFHLERQTGGMTRDIERGVRGIESLVSFTLFNIFATLIEVALVLVILATKFDAWFAGITLAALALYITYTVLVTEWRTQFRREANEFDSAAHTKAVDSLLNYETVKYFNNEGHEAARYDINLQQMEEANVKSYKSLAVLNIGQNAIVTLGVTALMWKASYGVVIGKLSIGDLVLVNAYLLQMAMPLNYLGMMYREVKQALTNIERLWGLLDEEQEVRDRPEAVPLNATRPRVVFDDVRFGYDPRREILHGIGFEIPSGHTVAVVGHSGSGKSTLARLLYRFYDVGGGGISIDGSDLRMLTQDSVRAAIGIVPQDTVLFNDSIRYNIRYGRPSASDAEVEEAARSAHIHDFILTLPDGYDSEVGERGLKLSGGEKQRVAIARALLKNPAILIFDEATSALDSASEKAIQAELDRIAIGRTTLVIAHRLSTVMDADEILVMDAGRIIERGSHAALIAKDGYYAAMWRLQQQSGGASSPASPP